MAFVLPPLAKISLITAWTGSVLYGINCVVYGLCMYVLLRGRRSVSNCWVLIVSSTLLFFLTTVYSAASLQQLLDAFIYVPPDVPDYATIYFLTPMQPLRTLKDMIFVLVTLVQDAILLWRLFVVFDRNWTIIIIPVLVDAAAICVGFADSIMYASPNPDDTTLINLSVASWSLDLVLNVSVTLAIAARLWWMGRELTSIHANRPANNPFASSVYVLIESGGIYASMTIVLLVLYVTLSNTDSPLDLALMDVAVQLATLTPLLIVVRMGLGLTHGSSRPSRINVILDEESDTVNTHNTQQVLKDIQFRPRSSKYSMKEDLERPKTPNQFVGSSSNTNVS